MAFIYMDDYWFLVTMIFLALVDVFSHQPTNQEERLTHAHIHTYIHLVLPAVPLRCAAE